MSTNKKYCVLRKTTKLMKYELRVLSDYDPKRQSMYVLVVESMSSDLKVGR